MLNRVKDLIRNRRYVIIDHLLEPAYQVLGQPGFIFHEVLYEHIHLLADNISQIIDVAFFQVRRHLCQYGLQ